jgi:hypothetical protein
MTLPSMCKVSVTPPLNTWRLVLTTSFRTCFLEFFLRAAMIGGIALSWDNRWCSGNGVGSLTPRAVMSWVLERLGR